MRRVPRERPEGSGRPAPDRPPEVRRTGSREIRVDRQGPPGRDARVRDGTGTGPDLEGAGLRRLGPGAREETLTLPSPGYTGSMWKNRFDLPTLSLHFFGKAAFP